MPAWRPVTVAPMASAQSRWARSSWSRATFETALLGVGFLVLLFVLPHAIAGDDNTRFADIEQLIHHGHLTNSRYSLVEPLISAPFLLLGEVVASPEWWASHFNVFIVAIGLLAGFQVTRNRVEVGLIRKFALLLLFASFLTDRLRGYDTEIVTATLVVLGTLAVAYGRHPRLGWAAIVIGVVNTPAALGGLALVAGAQSARTKRLRPLLAVAVALLLVMVEAWLRRGSPFTTGYAGDHGAVTIMPYSGRPGFSYPFILGIASILFSFGRGLVFFAPGLLLWLGQRTRRLVPSRPAVTLQLFFLAGLVLVYAKWWAWYGGLAWGPRFFVFAAVPASLFLAARLHAATDTTGGYAISLGVLALSAWVGLTGALENSWRMGFCAQQGFQVESLCWYTPDLSGLWWPVIHHPPLDARTVSLTAYCFVVFAYLATPLARGIVRGVAPLRAKWAHGWRF
jgi:hypothetical protein